MSPVVITPELMDAAAAFVESVQRQHQRQMTRAAIDAALDAQYWQQVDAGAVGASLPLVADDGDDLDDGDLSYDPDWVPTLAPGRIWDEEWWTS